MQTSLLVGRWAFGQTGRWWPVSKVNRADGSVNRQMSGLIGGWAGKLVGEQAGSRQEGLQAERRF
jgi:hypothetical protein